MLRIKKIIEMMQKDMEVQRIYIVQKIQFQKEHLQLQIGQQIHRKQKKYLIQKRLPKFMKQEQIIQTRKNIMKQQNILKIRIEEVKQELLKITIHPNHLFLTGK